MSTTYSQLKQKVTRWGQDFGSDFVTSFDEGLYDAEMDISNDLRCDQTQFRDTISFVAGTYLYSKPAGAVDIRQITYVSGTSTVFMEQRRREWLMDYAPQPGVLAQRGAPKFWANYETLNTTTKLVTSQIYVAKTPDAAYTATAECNGRLTGLSSSNTTTWLSVFYDSLLFAACIRRMARFDENDDSAQMWDAEYQKMLQGARDDVALVNSDSTSTLRTR